MKLYVKGIIPPLVTPLLDNRTLDVKGLENLVGHLIEGGVHGLFILGTTGEATSLTYSLRKEVIRRTAALTGKKIPVFAGITDTSFDISVEMAFYAAECGIDGLVIAPPFYTPISQEEMMVYLEALVPELPLPFMIYNMPSCTKLHMSLTTIRKAKDLGAIGIKDSSGKLDYMKSIINEFGSSNGFAIITGTELHIPEIISNGGHGAIPGGANIFPRLFVELYNASVEGNTARIHELELIMEIINNDIYYASGIPRIIQGIKSALSASGLCSDYVAWPLRTHKAEEKIKIGRAVAEVKKMINQISF